MDRRTFLCDVARGLVAAPFALHDARAQDAAASPLSTLAPGTARRLGPYANRDFADGAAITDYSSLVHDAAGQRMLIFGGGHGPSQETDVRSLDLRSLRWSSLYPPTPVREMTRANCDPDYGRYRTTNQPTARHSYNLTLVRERRFYMLCYRGMPDHLDGVLGVGNGWGGRICWYDFDDAQWSYSRIAENATPWYFASAAALDPVSAQILVVGPNAQGGEGALWLYDPVADALRAGVRLDVGYSHDVVYHPPSGRFVVLQGDGRVWEITLDRNEPAASRIEAVRVSGTAPDAKVGTVCGFAFDPGTGTIGGNVIGGQFHAYDVEARHWTRTPIAVDAGSGGVPSQAFHCLDLDPASGCYVFLATPVLGAGDTPATWAYRPPAKATRRARAGVADLRVELDLGADGVVVFDGARAEDRGAFAGEHVRQRAYLARHPQLPDWRVWFRVDENAEGERIAEPAQGWRDEIVVEYGRSTGGTPRHREAPYTATLTKAGTVVARYTVARHPWYARWRHASSQRPIVRTPAALHARGWLPRFGPEGMFGGGAAQASVEWPGPMGVPARPAPSFPFDPTMGAAGDHEQIGILTESAASYVLFGNDAALTTLRTEGEWCANWCMHIRHDETGAMPDFRDTKSFFRSAGGAIADAPQADPAKLPGYVSIEAGHWYPCANLPWLLTDDPFHLESLQFGVNWRILYDRTPRIALKLPGLLYPLEARSLAWGLRDLFLLAATCPERVPDWLRPRAYWRDCLADNRAYAERFASAPARIHALFRAWPRADLVSGWMAAWLSAIVGIAVEQGFDEWAPIFAWSIDAQIQMTNGTSGWSRQWPVPYTSTPNKAPGYYGSFDYVPHDKDRRIDATTCGSWAEYWTWYASGGGGSSDGVGATLDTTGWDGHTLMAQFHPRGYASYFLHLRCALAVAVTRGIPGARACYDYLQGELATALAKHYRSAGQARFSIDPGERA